MNRQMLSCWQMLEVGPEVGGTVEVAVPVVAGPLVVGPLVVGPLVEVMEIVTVTLVDGPDVVLLLETDVEEGCDVVVGPPRGPQITRSRTAIPVLSPDSAASR